MTLRVLAVDDERPALDDLARVLRAQPAVAEVETAESGEEALHVLAGGERYDAVFLDVRMPGLDGVELARVLRRFAAPPALIFVSAYESAAVEAFELRALDYLMKPVSTARVAEALARIEAKPEDDTTQTLAVDAPGGGTRLIQRADVLYLQAHGDYVRVHLTDARHLVRGTLNEIERRWAPHGFHRVHRRFLVNLKHATEVRPQLNGTATLILADGSELPIARREVAELRRRLRS
ncbi:LytTR family DNA-binding domain-containing protein [Solirubrobacter phytolaccae]|uniref:LytTR family DNA-binding domain-containing protein n=1 Tax=Solirubrobacter phytolaccae TaxID=1404360 RepID=A0A9X3N3Q9_9ACTN|nr:LytTR family DNA-binding domain-containing protein [Solirubrobacter phytolaccae]MDA0178906.1 LytTR family DNA-binding domain-containing protein [Solirubrobacter phytolaccae]